jgi:decaprenylphospho-beta-D-erythro-pentofuranosid-2-ulose 2-reductase
MRNAVGAVQSVLVLGGTSEIAMATVDLLAARGCSRVVLAARQVADLDDAETRARAAGATTVERLAFDARTTTEHDALLEAAFRGGDIDLVFLAFGVLGEQDSFERAPETAVDAVEANFVGAVSLGLRSAERLRAQGHGTIAVLSSVAGERVRAANYVYGSSKAEGVAADIVRGLERGAEIVWSPRALRPVMSVLRHVPRAVFRRLPV